MHAHPLQQYLADCRTTRATRAGTPETAYYTALHALLTAAGGGLKPRVTCVMGLKDRGAGMPDGGLFTPDQFRRGEDHALKDAEVGTPSRGVVECKPLAKPVLKIADTQQVNNPKMYN